MTKISAFVRNLPTKEKIPFIISLTVISLGLIAYGIFVLVGIIWLNYYKIEFYSPPFDDYVELSYYSANRGEFLGDKDLYNTCYELDGLPIESYLLIDKASGFTTVSHKDIVVMNKKSAEPFLCYDVEKIEISVDDQDVISITDSTVINSVLAQRRNSEPIIRQHISYDTNAKMYFNLPCELTFECIIIEEGGKVLLLCYDAISYDWYEYDATEHLASFL